MKPRFIFYVYRDGKYVCGLSSLFLAKSYFSSSCFVVRHDLNGVVPDKRFDPHA